MLAVSVSAFSKNIYIYIYFTQENCQNSCFSEEYFTSFVFIHKGVILLFYFFKKEREEVNRRGAYPEQSLLFSGYFERQIQPSGCSID